MIELGRVRNALTEIPRNVWAVTIASFLTDISSEMVFNLLPLFLANVLGVRLSIVGLIEGVAETTAGLVKLYSGVISDRIGSRKNLAVAGYSLSTVAKPLLAFASSWTGVLAIRFTDRMGKGIRTAPRDALIADSIAPDKRGLAFGLHRAGDTAGAAIGLSLALAVIWYAQGSELILKRESFQLLAAISAIPAALAVLILIIGVKEISRKKRAEGKQPRSLRSLDRRFVIFTVAIALFSLGNSSDAFIILRAQERGIGLIGILLMLIVFNVLYAMISGPAGALSDKIQRRTIIVGGWIAYSLIYLGLALAQSAWQIWFLFALYGVYYGVTEGVSKAIVADLVSPDERGTAYGMFNAAISLTVLPASLIAGVVWQGVGGWQGFGPSAPFVFGSAMALFAAVTLMTVPRSNGIADGDVG